MLLMDALESWFIPHSSRETAGMQASVRIGGLENPNLSRD